MMRRLIMAAVLVLGGAAASAPASAHAAAVERPISARPASQSESGLAVSGLAVSGLAGSGLAGSGLAGSGLAGLAPRGPLGAAPDRLDPVTSGPVAVGYRPPVSGALTVLRRFDPPLTVYGPGHLGVDLALGRGGAVLAAADGMVRFAGPVAGRGVVVVMHPDGVSTEYEPVHPLVARGDVVRAGQPIGNLVGTHRGCIASCLHWGARRAGSYLDPLSLLRPLGPVRLLPW